MGGVVGGVWLDVETRELVIRTSELRLSSRQEAWFNQSLVQHKTGRGSRI